MDFLKNLDLSPHNILKISGVVLVGVLVFAIAVSFLKVSFTSVTKEFGMGGGMPGIAMSEPSYGGVAYDSVTSSYGKAEMQTLSIRNASPIMPPSPGYSTGDDAEEYEVTEYSASIETGDKEETCKAIEKLKVLKYVIFENSNTSDTGCSYTFKVEHSHVEEALALIKTLDPKDLSENTYTIKQQIDDYTAEEEILERKLASIDETLVSSIRAYNEITALATSAQNVDALAKIIDSRLMLLERLTQERVNINAQIERLARAKEQQLDRLVYTYFSVYVYENKFIDGESISESWKESVREFVRTVNKVLQDLTVNLIGLLSLALLFVVYGLLALLFAKYGWRVVKHIWNK